MCPVLRARDRRGLDSVHRSSLSQQVGPLPGLLCLLYRPEPMVVLEAGLKQKATQVCIWGGGVGYISMGLNVSSNACSFYLPVTCLLVLARIRFHVITDLFCKIPILTNAQLLLELVDLKCLYFLSQCLY